MTARYVCSSCLRRLTLFNSKFILQGKRAGKLNICPSATATVGPRFVSTTTSRNRKSFAGSSHTDTQLPVRYIYVLTSVGRWEEVPDGILFDVGYGDSMPDRQWSSTTPTVLGLHSSPGNHEDILPVLKPFIKLGCRVIAPNFPGYNHTDGINAAFSDAFAHSTDEKAEFIRDFLLNLGIERVDLVVGYGSGCYPLLRLITTRETMHLFKSAILISPWPHREAMCMKPYSVHRLVNNLWDRPFYRPLCRASAPLLAHYMKVKGHSAYEVITASRTMAQINLDEVAGGLVAADMLTFPLMLMYATDDELVENALYEELRDLLNIPEIQISEMDRDGNCINTAASKGYPKCIRFASGGHKIHIEHTACINSESWELIKYMCPSIK